MALNRVIQLLRILSLFCLFFSLGNEITWAQGRRRVDSNGLNRVLVNKRFKTEDKALEFMIRNSIPVMSLESPSDIERFKKLLRIWNPHIKDWRKLDSWENVYVYRENPIYDVSVGYHFYDNNEQLDTGGNIITENRGPTFDLRLNFIHSLEWQSYFNYKLMKKNNFQLANSQRIYNFPINHNLEYGMSYRPQFSNFSYGLALGWQQFSFMSFNNERYNILRIIEQNLQVSLTEVFWLIPSVSYRFSIFKHGSYLTLAAGYSPLGTKSLDDNSKKEDVTSFKWNINFKQYLQSNLWIKLYYQDSQMDGATKTNQVQYGGFIGLSF